MEKTITTTFCKTDDEKRIAYAIVYEPMKSDSQGDWMTAAEIEKMAHRFNASNKADRVDINHNRIPSGCKIVESFIARAGDSDFPEGALVKAVQCTPEVWQYVKSGKLTGFSIDGKGRRVEIGLPNDPNAKHELIDCEINWNSIVERPANRRSFSIMKSTDHALGEALKTIASAIEAQGDILDDINTALKGQQAVIDTFVPDDGKTAQRPVHKDSEPAVPAEVQRLIRLRDRLNDRLFTLMENPTAYPADTEASLLARLAKCEDELFAIGHEDNAPATMESRSAFVHRGGSSTFLQAGPVTTMAEEFGINDTNNISKTDDVSLRDNGLPRDPAGTDQIDLTTKI